MIRSFVIWDYRNIPVDYTISMMASLRVYTTKGTHE